MAIRFWVQPEGPQGRGRSSSPTIMWWPTSLQALCHCNHLKSTHPQHAFTSAPKPSCLLTQSPGGITTPLAWDKPRAHPYGSINHVLCIFICTSCVCVGDSQALLWQGLYHFSTPKAQHSDGFQHKITESWSCTFVFHKQIKLDLIFSSKRFWNKHKKNSLNAPVTFKGILWIF